MSKTGKIIYSIILVAVMLFVCSNLSKATTVEVTTETLNLRKKASTDSAIVALISEGDECEILGEEGEWYKVRYGNYTGYVSKEYVKVIGKETESSTNSNTTKNNTSSENSKNESNESNNEAENKGENEEISDNNEEVSIASSNEAKDITATTIERTSLRITPLIQGSVLGNLQNNTEVTVISRINGWVYIGTDTMSGWVREDTLKINEANNNTTSDNTDNSDTSDNTDTSDNADSTDANDTTSDFEKRTMYTIDYVNIREKPSTSANIIMVVAQNTALTVIGETGDWYEVETSKGNAYVSKNVMSETKTKVTSRGNVDRTTEEQESKKKDTSNKKEEAEVTKTSTSNNSKDSSKAEEVVSYAKEFLGVPYVYGGASSSGFDCSGFTMYVYKKFGISMSHSARAQSNLGKKVNVDTDSKSSILNNLKTGDLVFFLNYETMNRIGHCGIYIGNGEFIHASSGSGYCVKINSLLPGEYYNTRFCSARRFL